MSQVYKLVVNLSCRGLIMNKDKHGQVHFMNEVWRVCKAVNWPSFMDADVLGPNLMQVCSMGCKIKQNVPIQVGKWILDVAKVQLLYFQVYVMGQYINMSKIQLISLNMDSFTMAITWLDPG